MSQQTYARAKLNLSQISKRFENDVLRAIRVQAHGGTRQEAAVARLGDRILAAMDSLFERLDRLSAD